MAKHFMLPFWESEASDDALEFTTNSDNFYDI